MIQILTYGAVPNEEIFARAVPTVDVAGKRISVVREKLDEVAVWEE